MKYLILAVMLVLATSYTAAASDLSPRVTKAIKKCRICHGQDLTGKKKAPGIIDKSLRVIYASLTRDIPKQMKPVAKGLTRDEALIGANYVANLSPSPD